MKFKKVQIVCLILFLLLTIGLLYFYKKKKKIQYGCVTETSEIEITDNRHMTGILEQGKKYEVLNGFYLCNPVEHNDVVLYRFSETVDPVVKIVRGIGGDHFEIVPDKVHGAWNLKINGDLIMAGESPYFFGGKNKPTLGLYEKQRNNTLGPEEVILLSNVPPGMDDSGVFGLISRSDLVGKVKMHLQKTP